ncbi:MAG: YqhA family protein [Deltaproteobacteria bacterium]|nr:YqhA family protein [Deltaproteobacteria bacterium]
MIVILAVIGSLISSVLMFVRGAIVIYQTAVEFFHHPFGGHDGGEEMSIAFISSVDSFLFATVLLIFAMGIYELFISKIDPASRHEDSRPNWLDRRPQGRRRQGHPRDLDRPSLRVGGEDEVRPAGPPAVARARGPLRRGGALPSARRSQAREGDQGRPPRAQVGLPAGAERRRARTLTIIVVIRVRTEVDASDIHVPSAMADAEELHGCQAALAVRAAAK